MNFKLKVNNVLLVIGALLVLSCSSHLEKKFHSGRNLALSTEEETFLEKGLYPESLVSKNIFEKNEKIKVVFNLPPYTNPGGVGIVSEILNTINQAKYSIRMSMFQFNHAGVFEALKNAIKRNVKVFVTTDLCYSGKVGYKEYFDSLKINLKENGQNPETQVVDDKTATCEGVFNHNKYMVVDIEDEKNVKAWFGSYNPTNHGSVENVELAFLVEDKTIAETLKLDFDQQIAGRFKVAKNGVFQIIKGNEKSILAIPDQEIKNYVAKGYKVTYPKIEIGDTSFELILSPKVKSITRIIEEIYNANEEILFSSYAIADQMLISSLINKSSATGMKDNIYSILALPHPGDNEGYDLIKNGDISKKENIYEWSEKQKSPDKKTIERLKPIASEIKSTLTTPVNYLTPKNEIKSVFRYIFPKGTEGGEVKKVLIEGIFNNKVIDEENTYARLAKFNIPVYRSSLTGELHNKLFLIDSNTTIFGSHNFSQSAETSNDELTVIVKSKDITEFLKNELFLKTKLFAVKNKGHYSFSSSATVAITEIMAESKYKMLWNKKQADIGDYIELYNYGDAPVSLLGYRLDDHFFPKVENEKMELANNIGAQSTLVRYIPNVDLNKLGTLDYDPKKNILGAKKVALIVGKYFNPKFYQDKFILEFKKRNQRDPKADEYPILFSSGEYFSSMLGDSTNGITSKDRLTIFGIDGSTVVDRFTSGRIIKQTGVSLERVFDDHELNEEFSRRNYKMIEKKYFTKTGKALTDLVFSIEDAFSKDSEWKEVTGDGTPGIVLNQKRDIASSDLYTIEGEYADVETNTFKKATVVIKDGKFFDIVENNKNYPAPIVKDVLIFPGFIDAHNHIKYNTMPIWKVKKVYENRNQWPDESVYQNGVKELYKAVYMNWPECDKASGLNKDKCLANKRCEIIKYGEIKGLIGGTTSIQGSSSFDETTSDITFKGLSGYNVGDKKKNIKSKARMLEDLLDQCTNGLARNIERETWNGYDEIRTTAQPITSDSFAKLSIGDQKKFLQTPSYKLLDEFKNKITNTFFIHLGEGKDQSSKSEWNELVTLKLQEPQITVIHGTAFSEEEFKSMGEKGISLAWSPTSNLLLYKKTTDVVKAIKNKVNVALGSDWSLSGTKSMLDELKVADMTNKKYFNSAIDDLNLLKMATINGAKASHLTDKIGSIEKNKLADFFIVSESNKDKTPLSTLLKIKESSIDATFVGGLPVLGKSKIISLFNRELNLEGLETSLHDESCNADLSINMKDADFGQLIDDLSSKTELGHKKLKPKIQDALGIEFSKLDPLCGENDKRYISILESL